METVRLNKYWRASKHRNKCNEHTARKGSNTFNISIKKRNNGEDQRSGWHPVIASDMGWRTVSRPQQKDSSLYSAYKKTAHENAYQKSSSSSSEPSSSSPLSCSSAPLSSSSLPSSRSTTASCLSWYSVIKSLTFLSASWNSISSIPSPLYQCRNAFLLYILANCALIRWKTPLMAVVFATKVDDISHPSGGTVMMALLILFGIHVTKSSAIFAWILAISSSTS